MTIPTGPFYDTSNSGLPDDFRVNSEGSSMPQDNIWFGTGFHMQPGGGVAKFDGTNWNVYNSVNSGLPG